MKSAPKSWQQLKGDQQPDIYISQMVLNIFLPCSPWENPIPPRVGMHTIKSENQELILEFG